MTCFRIRSSALAIQVLAPVLLANSAFAQQDFTYDFEGLQADQSIIGQDEWVIVRIPWQDVRVETGPGECSTLTAVSEIPGGSAKGAQRALKTNLDYSCNDQEVVWRARCYNESASGNSLSVFYVALDLTPSPDTTFAAGLGLQRTLGGPVRAFMKKSDGEVLGDTLLDNTCYEVELRVNFSQPGGVATLWYRNLDANQQEFRMDSVLQDIALGLVRDANCRYTVHHVMVRLSGQNGARDYIDDLYMQAPGPGEPSDCQPVCDEDLNCDGIISIIDFLQVLAAWGPCPGCPGDIDGDDNVGIVDFLALLAAWGPCQ